MRKLFLLLVIIFFALLVIRLPSYAAPIGNYLVLNGGYVKTSNNNSSIPTSFSFSASIYPNSISGKQIILSIGDKNIGKRYYEISINGGSLSVEYNYNNGSHTSITAGNISSGNWQDIKVEINSNQTKLLINRVEVFSPFINNTNLSPIGPNIVLGASFTEIPSNCGGLPIVNGHYVLPGGAFLSIPIICSPDDLGQPMKGLIDEVNISNTLFWHLDAARGVTTANDSSGNNLNGTLIGGDSLIHFYGVPPTPTPFVFQPIQWQRPVFPTLSFPFPTTSNPFPTSVQPPPLDNNPPPTSGIRNFPRPTRDFKRDQGLL